MHTRTFVGEGSAASPRAFVALIHRINHHCLRANSAPLFTQNVNCRIQTPIIVQPIILPSSSPAASSFAPEASGDRVRKIFERVCDEM